QLKWGREQRGGDRDRLAAKHPSRSSQCDQSPLAVGRGSKLEPGYERHPRWCAVTKDGLPRSGIESHRGLLDRDHLDRPGCVKLLVESLGKLTQSFLSVRRRIPISVGWRSAVRTRWRRRLAGAVSAD